MKVLIPSAAALLHRAARGRGERRDARRASSPTSTASYPGIRFRMIDEQDRMRPPHPLLRQRRAGASTCRSRCGPTDEVRDRPGAERRLSAKGPESLDVSIRRPLVRQAGANPHSPGETTMRFMIIVKADQGLGGRRHAGGEAPRRDGDLPRGAREGRRAASTAPGSSRARRAGASSTRAASAPSSTGPSPRRRSSSPATRSSRSKSREEALEWTKRFPNPAVDGKEGEIEVRQLFELEDFGESATIDRFRDIGVGGKK